MLKKQSVLFFLLFAVFALMTANIAYKKSTEPPTLNADNVVVYTDTEIAKQNNRIYKTETGKKYHLEECRYLKKSKFATTLSEAKAVGLTPCSVCNPPK